MKTGFTLIEVLVVVLIIGILTSIALPQYQKAVLKTRYMQAMLLGKEIWQAQQLYKLANDTYANHFEDLDITMPPTESVRPSTEGDSSEYYFYPWGFCWISDQSYNACLIYISASERAWYLAYLSPSETHECWAEPTTSATANALCKSLTQKTSTNGHYPF
jgi:type IV pilus assembly protein PilE